MSKASLAYLYLSVWDAPIDRDLGCSYSAGGGGGGGGGGSGRVSGGAGGAGTAGRGGLLLLHDTLHLTAGDPLLLSTPALCRTTPLCYWRQREQVSHNTLTKQLMLMSFSPRSCCFLNHLSGMMINTLIKLYIFLVTIPLVMQDNGIASCVMRVLKAPIYSTLHSQTCGLNTQTAVNINMTWKVTTFWNTPPFWRHTLLKEKEEEKP